MKAPAPAHPAGLDELRCARAAGQAGADYEGGNVVVVGISGGAIIVLLLLLLILA